MRTNLINNTINSFFNRSILIFFKGCKKIYKDCENIISLKAVFIIWNIFSYFYVLEIEVKSWRLLEFFKWPYINADFLVIPITLQLLQKDFISFLVILTLTSPLIMFICWLINLCFCLMYQGYRLLGFYGNLIKYLNFR